MFADSYKDYIPSTEVYHQISDRQIQEAILLQGHVIRFAENINSESERLSLGQDIYLNQIYLSLFRMKEILWYIAEKKVKSDAINWYMKEIIKDLKIHNTNLKNYFEQKELDAFFLLKKQQEKFAGFTKKLTHSLEILIKNLSIKLKEKNSLSEKEREIVQLLIELNGEKNQLKEFENKNFTNLQEMKNHLATSILRVKEIIKQLREY